jgi:hypothetical protein
MRLSCERLIEFSQRWPLISPQPMSEVPEAAKDRRLPAAWIYLAAQGRAKSLA